MSSQPAMQISLGSRRSRSLRGVSNLTPVELIFNVGDGALDQTYAALPAAPGWRPVASMPLQSIGAESWQSVVKILFRG